MGLQEGIQRGAVELRVGSDACHRCSDGAELVGFIARRAQQRLLAGDRAQAGWAGRAR
jgi:hypothetical protein